MNTSDLLERYKITRGAFYRRLEAVGISLPKDNTGKSYATTEQLNILDDLHHHLINGGRFANYNQTINVESASIQPGDTQPTRRFETEPQTTFESRNGMLSTGVQSTGQVDAYSSESNFDLLERLVGAIATNLQPTSKIRKHEELQKAMDNNWLLESSEVREITGRKTFKGDSFQVGGWRFVKSGKSGKQFLWKVDKVQS